MPTPGREGFDAPDGSPLTLQAARSIAKGLPAARRDNGITSKLTIGGQTRMHGTTTTQFKCVACNALYHLIKVETGPETVDREIKLPSLRCAAPCPRWPIRPQVLSFAETEPTPALTRHRADCEQRCEVARVATATDSAQPDTGIDRFVHFAGLTAS